MIELREYHDQAGSSPFRAWFDKLNPEAARKVTAALYRIGLGNFGSTKSLGAGIHECRINFGPGYRVFGKNGELIVILLGGGTKKGQQQDIELAMDRWKDYKRRRRQQRRG